MRFVRIATVAATDRKYIVQQIDYGTKTRVHCWGELVGFSATQAPGVWLLRHAPSAQSFDEADVAIESRALDEPLLRSLIRQASAVLKPRPRLSLGPADADLVALVRKACRV